MTEQIESVEIQDSAPPVEAEIDVPPQRGISVRDSLRQTFDNARAEETREEKRTKGRFSPTGAKAAREPGLADQVEQGESKEPPQTEQQTQAPAAWPKEARDTSIWGQIPAVAQAAITKREQDTQKGVDDLKAKYAPLDQALQPALATMQAMGKTPPEFIRDMLGWHNALTSNPDAGFPALLQAYGYHPGRLLQLMGYQFQPQTQAQAEPQQQEQQPQQQIPDYVYALNNEINQLKHYQQSLNRAWEEQSRAQTNDALSMWAKDKPHFEKVRVMMASFLAPDPNTGTAVVPFKDGKIDLDRAYEMATYAHPEVRAQLQSEAQAKEAADRKAKADAAIKAQKDQVNKAKRAATSIKTSAPGDEISKTNTKRGMSVRDSLIGAIDELNS